MLVLILDVPGVEIFFDKVVMNSCGQFRLSHESSLMTLAFSCRHQYRGQTHVIHIETRALVCLDLIVNDAC